MKTLEEIYNEIMANDELKTNFAKAAKENKQIEFLKEQGCETTKDELKAFMDKKLEEDSPLSLNELDNAAGGGCNNTPEVENESNTSIGQYNIKCKDEVVYSADLNELHDNTGRGKLCASV